MTNTNPIRHECPPPLEKGLDSKVAVFGYCCLCLNALFFSYLLSGDPWTSHLLRKEDGLVENLTVVWFLLAGLLLFATALVERSFFRRCIYILGGLAMMFVCGEEINWGQRIFGFATPDLMGLNARSPFNVHNNTAGNTGGWEDIRQNGTLLLCMVTGAAFFCRKDKLFGIPLPSILLVLGFLMVMSIHSGQMQILTFVFAREKELLFVVIYALLSKQGRLFMITVATAALVVAVSYVEHKFSLSPQYTGLEELNEYLFGIVCLFYSLELLLAQGRLAAISWAPFTGLKLLDRRSFWLMICSLFIGGSIGLTFFAYDAARDRTVTLMETYRSVRSAEPVIRSDFDVYLMRNQLIYFKDPCEPADIEPRFFLHIIPADANDLPLNRKRYGFDNLNFNFGDYGLGMSFGGKCLMTRSLPDYKITNIRTGQFTREDGQWKHFWEAEVS